MSRHINEEIEEVEIKNLKYWSAYYAKENEKFQNAFRILGFDQNDLMLSEKCKIYFDILLKIAENSKLEDMNKISFSMIMSQLLDKKYQLEYGLFKLTNEANKLNEMLMKFCLFQEALRNENSNLESEIGESKIELEGVEKKIDFMKIKLEKYKLQVKELESYNNTIDKELMHENIVGNYQNLISLQDQIKEMEADLAKYEDLPPNVNLANLKINQIKNEILKIDQEIESKLRFMNI